MCWAQMFHVEIYRRVRIPKFKKQISKYSVLNIESVYKNDTEFGAWLNTWLVTRCRPLHCWWQKQHRVSTYRTGTPGQLSPGRRLCSPSVPVYTAQRLSWGWLWSRESNRQPVALPRHVWCWQGLTGRRDGGAGRTGGRIAPGVWGEWRQTAASCLQGILDSNRQRLTHRPGSYR